MFGVGMGLGRMVQGFGLRVGSRFRLGLESGIQGFGLGFHMNWGSIRMFSRLPLAGAQRSLLFMGFLGPLTKSIVLSGSTQHFGATLRRNLFVGGHAGRYLEVHGTY